MEAVNAESPIKKLEDDTKSKVKAVIPKSEPALKVDESFSRLMVAFESKSEDLNSIIGAWNNDVPEEPTKVEPIKLAEKFQNENTGDIYQGASSDEDTPVVPKILPK